MAIMKKKFCPQCGSEDVELIDSNDKWMCAECGFTGKFPEHSVTGREDDLDEDSQEVDPDAEYLKYKSAKRGMEEDEEEMDEEDEEEPKPKKTKTVKTVKSKTKKKTVKKPVKKSGGKKK